MYLNPLNTFRMSGLASGIDTESIVQQLMSVERIPLDKLKQNKQLLEWTQEAYRDINSILLGFRNQVFNMSMQSTFLINKVTLSDETVATASASPSAAEGVYSLKVDNLATAAKAVSSGAISVLKNVITGGSISAPTASNPINIDANSNSFQIRVNGGSFTTITLDAKTYDGSTNTLNDLVSDIQGKLDSAGFKDIIKVYLTSNNKLQFVADNNTTFELKPAASNDVLNTKLGFDVPTTGSAVSTVQGVDINEPINLMIQEGRISGVSTPYIDKITFSITSYAQDGTYVIKDFTVDPGTQSIQSVISLIQNAGLSLTGFYGNSSDQVSFTSKYTGDLNPGTNNDIIINDTGGFLANVLKITQSNVIDGTNAQYSINGIASTSKANTFTVNGVTFTLKRAGTADISVQRDIDAVVSKIEDFVNQYNDTLDKIYAKLTEKRYRDYPPLTDEQKNAMNDKDIELWEEKAKSGLLNGDSILYDAFYKIRNAVSDTVQMVNSSVDHIFDIGITSGQWFENGHLYIDETKLREALSTDPDGVMQLFTKYSSTVVNGKDQIIYDESGIAQRLYAVLTDTINAITDKAGQSSGLSIVDNSVLGKQMSEIDQDITDMEARLTDIENRYYSQFTAMEQALNQMNSQSAWLAQQLGAFQQ